MYIFRSLRSSPMQRWRGVWNILRTVENFLRIFVIRQFILRENNIYIYIFYSRYSTKKWISFPFYFLHSLAKTRFSRGLFCSFLSARLFHPFQYFFRIPGCRRFFARSLTFQPRVCTSHHGFHRSFLVSFLASFLFFSFPFLSSLFPFPPPTRASNERTSFRRNWILPRPRVMLAIGLFCLERRNDALASKVDGEGVRVSAARWPRG